MEQADIATVHQESGSLPLLPSDLRLLRERYLSTNCILDWRDWVITILAVQLALRQDEFHNIHEKQFLPEHFQIDTARIEALAFQVCDRRDQRWYPMKIYADHDTKDFCPVRALVIYLYLIGWKGGYIFPTSEELQDPPSDRIYKTHIDNERFLEDLKAVCQATLPSRTPELKIGGETFRQTYYVMGVFGNAKENYLKDSARHSKNDPNAQAYYEAGVKDFQTHQNNPTNNVSQWQPIRIDPTNGNDLRCADMGLYEIVPLTDMPAFLVHVILGVPKGSPETRNVQYLIERAGTIDSAEHELAALTARMPVEESDRLNTLINNLVDEHVQRILKNEKGG